MAKRLPPGKCVHCIRFFEKLTWDHVFPKSWYPDTTSPNLEKWKIPSCKPCNSEYGRLEDDLMIRIGLCLDPNDPKSLGIPQKAVRAISPQFAKDENDTLLRDAKCRQILGQASFGHNEPDHGMYPNFGNVFNVPKQNQIAISISPESVRRLTEKIVRGITFLEDSRYIESPYEISFYALHDKDAFPVVSLIKRFGKVYANEPGIIITRAVLPEDRLTSLYLIDIWWRFKMYGHVGKEGDRLSA